MYLGDIYTIAVNLAGLPAISLPCGKDRKGLPIGLQLIGDCFQEKKLIRVGTGFPVHAVKPGIICCTVAVLDAVEPLQIGTGLRRRDRVVSRNGIFHQT